MKIKFKKLYTATDGKVIAKDRVLDIWDPVARDLIKNGFADLYQEPMEMEQIVMPSLLLDANGKRLEVVREVPKIQEPDEDGTTTRSKGKDS